MFAFVKRVRLLFLFVFFCNVALADPPGGLSPAPNLRRSTAPDVQFKNEGEANLLPQLRLASFTIDNMAREEDDRRSAEPFNISTVASSPNETSAKWVELQSRIAADDRMLAACRSDDNKCSQAARRFLSIVEIGHEHHGRARLAWVNRAVNLSIRPMSDWAQYGYANYWASPLETLRSGAGDCKDYAIVKYVVLRNLGIDPDHLRLVIVRDDIRQTEHEIVAVRYEQKWTILDNLTLATISAEQARQYHPLFVMDYRGVRTYSTVAASH
jgi:predicted transglutaminase-like cysteine proteinase